MSSQTSHYCSLPGVVSAPSCWQTHVRPTIVRCCHRVRLQNIHCSVSLHIYIIVLQCSGPERDKGQPRCGPVQAIRFTEGIFIGSLKYFCWQLRAGFAVVRISNAATKDLKYTFGYSDSCWVSAWCLRQIFYGHASQLSLDGRSVVYHVKHNEGKWTGAEDKVKYEVL